MEKLIRIYLEQLWVMTIQHNMYTWVLLNRPDITKNGS
jgi:hypothetical protein